jgi:16S rRNA (guanine527-N7)-methyltransferase
VAGESLRQALELLEPLLPDGISPKVLQRLQDHLALVRQWNGLVNLVSQGDETFLEERHLVDSLSLVPYVLRHTGSSGKLLDIGSGGGFPGIVIQCVLPELTITLVERSSRKSAFLQRAAAQMKLGGLTVIQGNFPEALPKIEASCITARAVERPRQFIPALLKRMPFPCAFLCQSEYPAGLLQKTFHVEHVDDPWRRAALRRGELQIITYHKHP